MSTPQSIPHLTPRFRIGLGTALSVLGVLVAIAVAVTILALTGANRHPVPVPGTAAHAAGGSAPQTRYLAPHQELAAQDAAATDTAGIGNPTPHYTCLGAAQRCIR